MESVVRRLRAQCGIVSKLRHFVPRKQLVKFCMKKRHQACNLAFLYKTAVATRVLNLSTIYKRKLWNSFFPLTKRLISRHLFAKLPAVFELHIYELLKFVLHSKNTMHSEGFLNNLFTLQKTMRITKQSHISLLNPSAFYYYAFWTIFLEKQMLFLLMRTNLPKVNYKWSGNSWKKLSTQ